MKRINGVRFVGMVRMVECMYDEIEIGEVFAWEACCCVAIKTKDGGFHITCDTYDNYGTYPYLWNEHFLICKKLYKLPKSFTKNFIEYEK